MRSTEEMKQLVRREAARRRRRRLAALFGAVGVVALLVVGFTATGSDPDAPAEVSTADGTAGPSTATSIVTRTPPAPVVEPPVTVTELTPGTAPADLPGPPTAPSAATGAPAGATVTTDEPDGEADPGAPPGGPEVAPPSTPTTAPIPTTDPPVRICSDADFVRTELWFAARDSADLPAFWARTSDRTEFGYSVLVGDAVEPCISPDSLLLVTITDSSGHEVLRHTLDGGPGQLVWPGRWVRFSWTVAWTPSCEDQLPLPGGTVTCEPAGVGTYWIHVYDQGATFDPLEVQLVADG